MNISKRAFITGVYGQDGSYLAEYLLDHGYVVLGLVHERDVQNTNGKYLTGRKNFSLCVGDFGDLQTFSSALNSFLPNEVYNLAAVSDLKTARENPEYTHKVNFHAFEVLVAHVIETFPQVRVFQALSSRLLMPDANGVITEFSTLAKPKNAYDEAKRASYEDVVLKYRKNGFYIASGFLCNHESPRRDDRFVTGKIARGVARISSGLQEKISMGNIDVLRDWSFAGDVVRAMHAIVQNEMPLDYVVGSGVLHSVREFIMSAFNDQGVKIVWTGTGIDEKGFDEAGVLRVEILPNLYTSDDNPVVGSTYLLEKNTRWKREVTFLDLVRMMVDAERKLLQ